MYCYSLWTCVSVCLSVASFLSVSPSLSSSFSFSCSRAHVVSLLHSSWSIFLVLESICNTLKLSPYIGRLRVKGIYNLMYRVSQQLLIFSFLEFYKLYHGRCLISKLSLLLVRQLMIYRRICIIRITVYIYPFSYNNMETLCVNLIFRIYNPSVHWTLLFLSLTSH